MRRTQLYLDDQLWSALHERARSQRTTVSALVREAARERYLGDREQRMQTMQEFIGIRKSAAEAGNAVAEVRRLRQGSRMDRLTKR